MSGAAPIPGDPLAKRRGGIILPIVLIIALLLSAAILTFVRRSVIDGVIVKNRQAAYSAEALARGGIRIATGFLFVHRYQEELARVQNKGTGGATLEDPWARLHEKPLNTSWGASSPFGSRMPECASTSTRWFRDGDLWTNRSPRPRPRSS